MHMEQIGKSARNVRQVPVSYSDDDHIKLELEKAVLSHWGFSELQKFGSNFQTRPLGHDELKVFFSTLVAFVGDIPGGILSLALRITDHWMTVDPLNATHHGAAILFAAVDEYGLHDMQAGVQRTHHQLFIDVAAHWGLTADGLMDKDSALPEGCAFGKRTADYYRFHSIPAALGFHYASEATSSFEFSHYLAGFSKFPSEYNVSGENDPALFFFLTHTEVETSHRDMAVEIMKKHGNTEAVLHETIRGVGGFMEGYGAFFQALNTHLFSK